MNPITTVVTALIEPVTGLISEFITDKDKAAEMAFKVSTMAAEQSHIEMLAQLKVNEVEAASGSLFIAGWRPAMGWICVLAFFLNFVGFPLTTYAFTVAGHAVVLPILDMENMMPVLLGMLGLGALRTKERLKGVERNGKKK